MKVEQKYRSLDFGLRSLALEFFNDEIPKTKGQKPKAKGHGIAAIGDVP